MADKNGHAQTSDDREVILNRIKAVWDRFPVMRLGQLIVNARWNVGTDMFYVDDETFAKQLEEFLAKHKGRD